MWVLQQICVQHFNPVDTVRDQSMNTPSIGGCNCQMWNMQQKTCHKQLSEHKVGNARKRVIAILHKGMEDEKVKNIKLTSRKQIMQKDKG